MQISGIDESPKCRIVSKFDIDDNETVDNNTVLSLDQISSRKTANGKNTASFKASSAIDSDTVIDSIWNEGEDHILWNARIFPVRGTMKEAVDDALEFWRTSKLPKLPRSSMHESFENADGIATASWSKE